MHGATIKINIAKFGVILFVEDWLRSLAVTSTGNVVKRHFVQHILRVSRWTISQGRYDVTDTMRR